MFKKNVFVESSEKVKSKFEIGEWLNKCANNFYCYSHFKLKNNNYYEIIYYKGESGVFRVNEARLISGFPIQQTYNVIQNVFIVNWINYYACKKPYCFSCVQKGIGEKEYKFCSDEKKTSTEYVCLTKHWTIYQGQANQSKALNKPQ